MTDHAQCVDRRRNDTRQRIIDAAVLLIAERGYAQTSVADLERAVGLRPGSGGLYRHFPTKDDVFSEVLGQYTTRVRDLRSRLADKWSQPSSETRHEYGHHLDKDLRHVLDQLRQFLDAEAHVVRIGSEVGVLSDELRSNIGEAWEEGYGILSDVLEHHGVQPKEARIRAVHALGAIDHYTSAVNLRGRQPLGVTLDEFVDHWIAAASPPPEAPTIASAR